MVDNKLIQRAIINKLKADSVLTAWLTLHSALTEIKEFNWQGSDFQYANIRVQLGTQQDSGNPPCMSEITFTIYCSTEGDSSILADELAHTVNTALLYKRLLPDNTDKFTTGLVTSGGAAKATRLGERVWQAVNTYSVLIYGGFNG